MRIIAIDPGYDRLGVAIMEHGPGGEALLFSTCIESSKEDPFDDRLLSVGSEFAALLDEYKPEALAIETLFFNKNQKTAINVAQARGALIYLAKQAGCRLFEFGPQEVKIAVTGYGKSDKAAVIDMTKRLVKNCPEKGHDDEFDAIAVGITCLATHLH